MWAYIEHLEARIKCLEGREDDWATEILRLEARIAELELFIDEIATHDSDIELVPPAEEPDEERDYRCGLTNLSLCSGPDCSLMGDDWLTCVHLKPPAEEQREEADMGIEMLWPEEGEKNG